MHYYVADDGRVFRLRRFSQSMGNQLLENFIFSGDLYPWKAWLVMLGLIASPFMHFRFREKSEIIVYTI